MKPIRVKKRTCKVAAGIALALGCCLLSSYAGAATYDMTSDYASGITLSRAEFGKQIGQSYQQPDNFTFGYDKVTDTIVGGDINLAEDMKNVPGANWWESGTPAVTVFATLDVKASDLPDLSLETIKKVNAAMLKKIKPAEGLTYNYAFDYMTIRVLDDDGTVLRSSEIKYNDNWQGTTNVSGGTFKQVLSNDSKNTEYDIKQEDTVVANGTIAANTWYIGNFDGRYGYTIAPDLTNETLKAAVRGAEKDLYVTNVLGNSTLNSTLNIKAEGTENDRVYGVYNDQKGIVSLTNNTFNITASGNAQSNVLYAGNDSDYLSKVVYKSTSDNRNSSGLLQATGDVVEAGKNGEITIDAARTDFASEKGNIFYAHDGGVINVGQSSKHYAGVSAKLGTEGKYLALAENGGQINIGMDIEHLDSIDYDKANVYTVNVNTEGDMKTDETSKILFGMKGKYAYTGDVDGNVALYMEGGATWNGSANGDNTALTLGENGIWNITSANNQHLKSLDTSTSSTKRSIVSVGAGNINIDKYTGSTTFVYQHDAEDASKILGGDITIKSVEAGKILSQGVGDVQYQLSETPSTIYLQTSVDGIDTTDEAAVNTVLDNLAKKLYYTGYVDGERNLSGRVEIAEGLTTAAISKYYSNITFDEKTGQAKKDNEVKKPYNGIIMGNEKNDSPVYGELMSGSVADGDLKYTFADDALIEVKLNEDPRAMKWGALYCAAINNYGDKPYQSTAYATKGGPSYTLDMQGHDLKVIFSAFPDANTTGSQPMWTAAAIGAFRDGTITIDNPGAIYLQSNNNYYYGSVIRASTAAAGATGAHVVINNDNSKEHAVTIRGGIDTPGYQLNWRAIEVTTQNGTTAANGNSVEIKGLVDIDVSNCASLFARGNYATIDIGGGSIVSHNYAAVWTAGTEAKINLNMLKDEEGNVTGAGDNYLQIEGDVASATPYYGANGTINVGLTTSDSYLKGHFYGTGTNNLYLQNGAVWDNKPLSSHNYSSGTISEFNADSVVTNLYGGESWAKAGNIYQNESKNITIGNLSGYVNAYIGHDAEDAANFDAYGNIIVEKAMQTDGKNAGMTLFTNRDGIDTSDSKKVEDVLGALAKKLIYSESIVDENNPEAKLNLDGRVGIAEGLTSGSIAIRVADLAFDKEDGSGSLLADTVRLPDESEYPGVQDYPGKLYGFSETAMTRGAKSAMASTAMLWRAESNDLMKRMGDLRLAEGDSGLWAKYYGGKYEMDEQNTKFSTSYKAYQLGYDTKAGDWTLGAAVSYNDGNSTYASGRGDEKAISLGLYGTWTQEDGQYLDLILKGSRLENEFKISNAGGKKLSGDYKTWAASLSAEYGKRFEGAHGFYVDPSVEFTVGRVAGKDYNAHSDFLDSLGVTKDLEVQQDAFTTAVGRLGVRFGQKLDNASYFVKLAAAHEFSGDFDTTYRAVGEPEGKTSVDFGDTWYEAQIGGTAKLGDNSLVYASFERSFGGDVEEKWRVDAGLRWSF